MNPFLKKITTGIFHVGPVCIPYSRAYPMNCSSSVYLFAQSGHRNLKSSASVSEMAVLYIRFELGISSPHSSQYIVSSILEPHTRHIHVPSGRWITELFSHSGHAKTLDRRRCFLRPNSRRMASCVIQFLSAACNAL